MIRALVLAVALSSVSSLPLAQEAPAAPPASAEVPQAQAAGEAEFEARAEAFGERMQAMAEEMRNAVGAAGGDAAKQDADLDAIELRYQADAEAFAVALEAFVNQQAAGVPEDQRGAMTAGMTAALPQIRSYPQQVRAQVEAAAAAPAPDAPAS